MTVELSKLQSAKVEGKMELEEKLSTTLELLGERTERVMELELDIEEMKQVYRSQVQELVDQLVEGKKR